MKKLVIVLLICLTSSFVNAQDLSCKDFHIGKFEMETEYGKVIISRTETSQVEFCKQMNYKASFDIIWKDDCTYELSNEKIQIGDKIDTDNSIKVKSKIYKIENNVFFLRVSTNLDELVLDCKIIKTN
jgi:hypothetical protein